MVPYYFDSEEGDRPFSRILSTPDRFHVIILSGKSTKVKMTTTIGIGTMIVSTPGTCGGRPRIAGRRLSVAQIAVLFKEGLSPEEIPREYASVTLAQVHAALAYYHANKDEIEAYLAEEAAEYERLIIESREGKL